MSSTAQVKEVVHCLGFGGYYIICLAVHFGQDN